MGAAAMPVGAVLCGFTVSPIGTTQILASEAADHVMQWPEKIRNAHQKWKDEKMGKKEKKDKQKPKGEETNE